MNRRKLFSFIAGASAAAVAAKAGMAIAAPAREADMLLATHGLGHVPKFKVAGVGTDWPAVGDAITLNGGAARYFGPDGVKFHVDFSDLDHDHAYQWPAPPADSTALAAHLHAA